MKQITYLLLFFLLLSSCGDPAGTQRETSAAPAGDGAADNAEVTEYELEAIPGADVKLAMAYDAEGRVAEEGLMLDGEKVGPWLTYHLGGEYPAKLITYVKGNYHGPYYEYNDRGQITLKAHYRNNKLDGDWASYQFGRPLKKAQYKAGELHGQYLEYDMKSGKLQKEINYKDGQQHGIFRFYDLSGNIIMEYEYENGKKVSGGATE